MFTNFEALNFAKTKVNRFIMTLLKFVSYSFSDYSIMHLFFGLIFIIWAFFILLSAKKSCNFVYLKLIK